MENNEENRECAYDDCNNCMQNDCKYTPQGINAEFGYNTAQIFRDDLDCYNSCNKQECMQNRNRVRAEMMKQIKCLSFAIVDIAEYLDTHPNAQSDEIVNNTNETENGYVTKSANNYLKSLSVEGYELEPEFIRENDAYTIYVKDRNSLTSLNIIAEADDEKAIIEGAGKIEVAPEQDVATIQVKAENGDTRVYTIKIEDEKNKEDGASINSDVIVGIVLVIIIILIAIFMAISKKKSGKKVE